MNRTASAAVPTSPQPVAHEDESMWVDRKAAQLAQRAAKARQSSRRRRLVDPATCDRHYSQAELEFMLAIQDYKAASGRMFPTWSEVLEVIQGLGYQKTGPVTDAESTGASHD